MPFFDFHHHHHQPNGIYNLNNDEEPPNYTFSVGIHPKDIDENFEINFEKVKEKSLHPNCIAIGECGLDGLIHIDERLQENVFLQHILWANEVNKPIIIHCIRRYSQLLKFKKIAKVPMVIHSFNKKSTIADELLSAGFYLSFGKAVLQNVSLQTLIKDIPLEKLFLETDDDDFEIKNLYEKVSEIKNINVKELQQQIFKNLEHITR